MVAFDIYFEGKRLCRAGVGTKGILTTQVTWAKSGTRPEKNDHISVHVSGLHAASREHRRWLEKELAVGDEVTIRIVDAARVDKPKRRTADNPKTARSRKEDYVRNLAKELGWTLEERCRA